MKRSFIFLLLLFLIHSVTALNLFELGTPPGLQAVQVCLKNQSCNITAPLYFYSDMYMNGYIIHNVTLANVTFNDVIYVNYSQVLNPIWVNKTGDVMTGDLVIDKDGIGDVSLKLVSDINRDSCINLTEGGIEDGFQLCNDGSGINNFYIANILTGEIYMTIDRTTGKFTFNKDILVQSNDDNNNSAITLGWGTNHNSSIYFNDLGFNYAEIFFEGFNNNFGIRNNVFNRDIISIQLANDLISVYPNLTFAGNGSPYSDWYCDSIACYNLTNMTVGMGEFLKLDGSNADQNIDIGGWNFTGEYIHAGQDVTAANGLYGSYLISNFVGSMDLRGDPWALLGAGLQVPNLSSADGTLEVPSNIYLSRHNLTLNGSIQFEERSGIQNLFFVNPYNGDGFRMEYWYDFELANDDWIVFHKTDGNDFRPDGGFAFMIGNSSGYNKTILKMDGYGLANFTDQNIITTGNVSAENFKATGEVNTTDLYVSGYSVITSVKNATVHLDNFVVHTQELMTDTLLDKSLSTLSCVNSQLNYTLIAFYGCGQFNFNGTLYPSDHACVANATITLNCGTNTTPVTNYVYWELVGDVPTMKASSTYPSTDHIDVAAWVVGNCTGTTYTIYAYSRNRYEVDTFVKRVIERFENSGTLYVDGLTPTANGSNLNITAGGHFFNGIFEMETANAVNISSGFYFINSSGSFIQTNNISKINKYADGSLITTNRNINVIWGIVPTSTTAGGVLPTNVKLVAVVPNKPLTEYTLLADAIADNYDSANYFPPNTDIKNVFVPVARTIINFRIGTPVSSLMAFTTGKYYQDIRGRITSGGGSSAAVDTSAFLLTDGSRPLTGNWNAGNFNVTLKRLTLTSNTTAIPCSVVIEGMIYYDNITHKHYGCNSTNWNAFY